MIKFICNLPQKKTVQQYIQVASLSPDTRKIYANNLYNEMTIYKTMCQVFTPSKDVYIYIHKYTQNIYRIRKYVSQKICLHLFIGNFELK